MAHLISFWTDKFDVTKERPNPVNPIAGESVLHWLRDTAFDSSYSATEPDYEDWGWYMDVTDAHGSYMVGSIAYADETNEAGDRIEWLLQIHRDRTIVEKILGKNKLADDEPIVTELLKILNEDGRIDSVVREISV